jgi:DnaK suppressor protein
MCFYGSGFGQNNSEIYCQGEHTPMNNGRLKHFKRKLLEKRELLAEMVQRTEGHGRENESETMDAADLAVASYTKEVMFGMSSMDHQKLQLIGNALERIKNHSYGICINCEKEILFNRLEAVPWAPYCVKCQSLLENN